MKRLIFKILRGGIFALICLVTFVALVFAEENWRGKRDWEAYKREVVARGERIDYAAVVPPPVPDEQNMAMTPLFRQLFASATHDDQRDAGNRLNQLLALDHSTGQSEPPRISSWIDGEHIDLAAWSAYFGGLDILQALKKFDPEFDEVTQAARLPFARFPVDYENPYLSLPHLSPLKRLAKLLSLRGQAALPAGQVEAALRDAQTISRLADGVQIEPTIISQMVAFLIRCHGEQIVWEGLSNHQWSDAQLTGLQKTFQNIDVLSAGHRALQGERAWNNDLLEKMPDERMISMLAPSKRNPLSVVRKFGTLFPKGFYYQNALSINRQYERYILPAINLSEHRVFPEMAKANSQQALTLTESGSLWRSHPYSLFLVIVTPPLTRSFEHFAHAQCDVDEAAIACALERYWLVQGKYPETLDALVPTYFQKLPPDVIGGQPLKYRREGDGYRLYSIGWNGADDGGKAELPGDDWVWILPGK